MYTFYLFLIWLFFVITDYNMIIIIALIVYLHSTMSRNLITWSRKNIIIQDSQSNIGNDINLDDIIWYDVPIMVDENICKKRSITSIYNYENYCGESSASALKKHASADNGLNRFLSIFDVGYKDHLFVDAIDCNVLCDMIYVPESSNRINSKCSELDSDNFNRTKKFVLNRKFHCYSMNGQASYQKRRNSKHF